MDDTAYEVYRTCKMRPESNKYFFITEQFRLSVMSKLSPHMNYLFNCEAPLNFNQILYETSMLMSLTEYYSDSTVRVLKTNKQWNEHDVKLIDDSTKEETNFQLKTITNTGYIEP